MIHLQAHIQEKIGCLFVNGAGLDSRIWSKVVEGLQNPCLLVDFPLRKSSYDSRKELSLEDYVAHMRNQVDQWGTQRFVIVAHSLGGIPALRLASELGDRLAGFIAVGAAIPKNGGSFLSTLPFPKRMLLPAILRKWGTKPPDSAIRSGLCNDLSEDQTSEIVRGFIPEAVRVYTDRVHVSIPCVPRLYVKLTMDKEFGPSLQSKMISNLSPQSVHSLEAGHLPMISNPEGLILVLKTFLDRFN